MSLFAVEVRICVDWTIQVTCKLVSNFSGNVHLLWSNYGQFLPISIQICGDPICHFIYSSSFRLNIWRKLALLTSFELSLGDVIVVVGSSNFAPKLELFDLLKD
jgi:hypothetical protein